MGQAAAQFVAAARKLNYKGKITCIGNEAYLPYHRPPLSKEHLQTGITEPKLIRAKAFYEEQNIECVFNTSVNAVNVEQQVIDLESGKQLSYDKLIIATGGSVNKLNIPNADLQNIFYLQSVNHAKAIENQISKDTKAVIIGGGFIGLEVAASLKKRGAEVIVLERENRILSRVTCAEVSNYIHKIHIENKVEIHLNTSVQSFEGGQKVEKVICENGEIYETNLVLVGIGIHPNVSLLENTNVDVNNGVVVNEFCQSSNSNIYAIGDCANFLSALYNKRFRLESVPNAIEHGNIAAAHICGEQRNYKGVPWFWSNQYDLKWQIAGINDGYETIETREENDVQSLVVWYFKENKLIAADCLNNPIAFVLAKILIANKTEIDKNRLVDLNVSLKDLIKEFK